MEGGRGPLVELRQTWDCFWADKRCSSSSIMERLFGAIDTILTKRFLYPTLLPPTNTPKTPRPPFLVVF